MNSCNFIFCIIFCVTSICASTIQYSYEEVINQNALAWKTSHINDKSAEKDIQTIIDVLLLSYQIAKESYIMILAKLSIQEELFKIYTPSLFDSWQDCILVEQNNFLIIDQSLERMKQSETVFQSIFQKFKILAKNLIKMNATPTQTLITDLKNSLIAWGKQQQNLAEQLVDIQDEFTLAIATISNIKTIFETMFSSSQVNHTHLQEAAGFVSKTYKDIESVIQHLTKVRKESMYKIDEFFITFFRTYYSMIYYELSQEQRDSLSSLATDNTKLPDPNLFFT